MNIYVQNRDYVISEFINNVKIHYRKDAEMIDAAFDLTTELLVSKPQEKFVNDLRGFIIYCSSHNVDRSKFLTTVYHDLIEFKNNREEKWFSPRTEGYSKYLSGATNYPVS